VAEPNGGWQWYAVGSAVFAAATALLGKLGVADIPPNLATFIRTTVILSLVAAVVTVRGEWLRTEGISTRGVVFLVASGLATGLSWLCYYHALRLGPASQVAPVDKLSVVLVIVFAVAFLDEPLTWRVAAGGLLVAAGAVLLAWK
jgi:transporter family protein